MPEANPRAVIGSNTPDSIDYAKEEVERLRQEYAELDNTASTLEEEHSRIPIVLQLADKDGVLDLMKRVRDTTMRCEGLHQLEKQPFLRRGQGVDQWFFGIIDRLKKRDKRNQDGIYDDLGRRLTDLDTRLLAEEQERRRRIAEEQERIRRAAEEARLKAEREAEEARLAAERARKPETQAKKEEIAQQAEVAASEAKVEETVAAAKAEEAYVDTLAKPADILRTRTAAGTLGTAQQEPYAEIENVAMLDGAKLWQFVTFDNKQKALLAWARSTDFREPMPGAKVGRRPKSRVR